MARRVPRTASGALRLTMSAISCARSSSRSCSTTSLIKPRSKARLASIRSCLPTSAILSATDRGSTRASLTSSRPATRPMLTCGSKNVAVSDAMTMSDVVTQSSPAPQQMPFTAVSTGLAMLRNGGVPSWGASHCS
ncbi:Enoyl-CoA hydratase [Mycobacterium marinum MB2]|nr:Enoyl-CoA hydratase [Mycobacterium marinum MB2]